MTTEEVKKIYEDNEKDFLKSASKNGFLDGLVILNSLSNGKNNYAAGHDIFYANDLDDLPKLSQELIELLNKLGWHFDSEYNCFSHHL